MLSSVKTGAMLELSEAIRDYHDLTGFPQMVSMTCNPHSLLRFVFPFFLSHAVGSLNVTFPCCT